VYDSNSYTIVKGIQHLSTSNVTLPPNFDHAQIQTKQAPFLAEPISLFPNNSSMHSSPRV